MQQPRYLVDSNWNVTAHGDAWDGNWRGNCRMEWVASTLHTTSEHGVSSITTADAHTSAASSPLNWRPSADLNGLVPFAERRNMVSALVPSHFNWPVPTVFGYELKNLESFAAHGDMWPCATVCAFEAIYWFFPLLASSSRLGPIWVGVGIFPHLKMLEYERYGCMYNEGNSQWWIVPFLCKLLCLLHPRALANIHCGHQAYTERCFVRGRNARNLFWCHFWVTVL